MNREPNTTRLKHKAMWGIFIVALILYWPTLVNAAITHDADCHGTTNSGPLTVSCTIGSLSNGILVCGVGTENSSPATDFAVTYNGSSMTAGGSLVSNGNSQTQIFYIKAPTSGTHNVVLSSSIVSILNAGCSSFDGVDQTTPIGNNATNLVNQTSITVTITLNGGNMLFGAVTSTDFNLSAVPTITPGAGQTETSNFSSAGLAAMETSYKTSGSDVSWTFTGLAAYVDTAAAVELKAGGGGGGGNSLGHRVIVQ